MKMKSLSVGILLAGCAAATACVTTTRYEAYPGRPPVAQAPPVYEPAPPVAGSDQPFYDDLAPYGRWVYVQGPGWGWYPYGIQAGWRPYEMGHWVFTDYGWTWASDEPYGWAVYHYGRWHMDPGYGWVWVPGTEWGPAWVAWHEGGGYVGWAPLPWQVTVRAGSGLDWGGVNLSLAPSSWCFVTTRYLVDPGLRHRIEPPARNVTLIKVTQNITNYTNIDNRVVNRGVKVEKVSRAAGRQVPHYRIAEAESAETARGGKVRGDELPVYRPDPRRGHSSHGRNDRPGRYERESPRDYRGAPAAPPRPNSPAGMPPAPPPSAQAPPDQAAPAPAAQPRGRESNHGRGNNHYDRKMTRQPLHNPPQPAGAAQPAPPAQPAAPSQPTAPAQPAPPSQDAAPAQTAAPANPYANRAPEKAKPAKARGKGGRKNIPKEDKAKPEESNSEQSDADKSKAEKPDSRH